MGSVIHPLPEGTRILSVNGELDDDDGVERHTGPNAIGEVVRVDQYAKCWSYGVQFRNGTYVNLDADDLRDEAAYQVVVSDMTPARTFAYTVVLLVPDYACRDVPYGQNTYTAYVTARNERHALELAQLEAAQLANDGDPGSIVDPLDFAPVLVFDGHPPIALYGWQL